MKDISFTNVLLYCDGPQIIEAQDDIGGSYIALLVDDIDGFDRYLICGIHPRKLRDFRVGNADLRSILVDSSTSEWGLVTVTDNAHDLPMSPEARSGPIDAAFLPDEGFFLHETYAIADEALVKAHERNNLVLEVYVEPPESASEHRIHSETLAGLLINIQTLIKHSYRRVVRDLPSELRASLGMQDGYRMDVFVPAVAGSFGIWLESSDSHVALGNTDLFSESPLHKALDIVDKFVSHRDDASETIKLARTYKGHLSGSYLRLLKFLKDSNSGLEYRWATPLSSTSKSGSLSIDRVVVLLAALSGVSDLGTEEVELRGTVDKADSTGKSWRIRDASTIYSGSVKDDGPDLEGIVIGERYLFKCLEKIEAIEGTGKEQRSLFLIERERLGQGSSA